MLNISELCVKKTASIIECLAILDKTAKGILFILEDGRLCGSLTDGDIRRALLKGSDKGDLVTGIYNDKVFSLHYKTPDADIQNALTERLKIIPLVDDRGCIVDYASKTRLHQFSVMEPLLGGNELEYVTDCIKTNWISSQGQYVFRFEDMIRRRVNAAHCITTSNGTTALHLALVALGIGSGDEVIVPNLTFGASVSSIIHAGAVPVLVDVDRDTWNISPELVRGAITSKTKAIMPVHLYGNPCDMESIMRIAKEHSLFVVEDCAEALGATIDGQPVGSFGDAAAFSFFANKIVTCGEGGALIFKDSDFDLKARVLRDHGMTKSKRYWHEMVGYNYRLTNIQAAIGCAQLEQIDYFSRQRIKIFDLYTKLLNPSSLIKLQLIRKSHCSSNWLYTFCLLGGAKAHRDEILGDLQRGGIETRPIFYPMDEMPAFEMAIRTGDLQVSRDISYSGLSLPSSVFLREDEIRWISKKVLNSITSRI